MWHLCCVVDGLSSCCLCYSQVEEAIASAEAAQKLRQQGNELMKQHKFAEAVTKYSEALASECLVVIPWCPGCLDPAVWRCSQ